MAYIKPEDVRAFILDRSIQDNDLLLDLAFSESEIQDAMIRVAREYNSVPPFVSTVTAETLSSDTNIFLDGIAQQLYLSELAKLMRNDIDYTSGGVETNLVRKRIEHLKYLIQVHGERFRQTATSIKLAINLSAAFGEF